MTNKLDKINQFKSQQQKTIENIFNKYIALGYEDNFLEQYSSMSAIEQIILDLNPNSPKAIITIAYAISLYAKYTNNDIAYQIIQNINKNELWEKHKPNADPKYISYNTYLEIVKDIESFEEMNSLYYETLFSCLYEGIFNEDLSVIRNLRKNDIHGDIITIRGKECDYELQVTDNLIRDLLELSEIQVWQRKNRHGMFEHKTIGLYPDSCFKIIEKKDYSEDKSYRFAYYSKLRKISKEYMDVKIHPTQIFISGIMYRISKKLKEEGITLQEAFTLQNRNNKVHEIILTELKRCNYNIPVNAFRQQVIGHIDTFE